MFIIFNISTLSRITLDINHRILSDPPSPEWRQVFFFNAHHKTPVSCSHGWLTRANTVKIIWTGSQHSFEGQKYYWKLIFPKIIMPQVCFRLLGQSAYIQLMIYTYVYPEYNLVVTILYCSSNPLKTNLTVIVDLLLKVLLYNKCHSLQFYQQTPLSSKHTKIS